MKKIVLMSLMISVSFSMPINAKELKKAKVVYSPKKFYKEENAGLLMGGVTLNFTDARIRNIHLNCENLSTGKVLKCFRARDNDYREPIKLSQKHVRPSRFEMVNFNLYLFPIGRYKIKEAVVHTALTSNQRSPNIDKDIIDISAENLIFEIKQGVNYFANLNLTYQRDSLYRPVIDSYSWESNRDEELAALPKKIRIKAAEVFAESLNLFANRSKVTNISYVKPAQWTSVQDIDWEGLCKKGKVLKLGLGAPKAYYVVDGKYYMTMSEKGFPAFPSQKSSKILACSLYQYLAENNYKEFRQTSNVTRHKEVKGFSVPAYNRSRVFDIEFR